MIRLPSLFFWKKPYNDLCNSPFVKPHNPVLYTPLPKINRFFQGIFENHGKPSKTRMDKTDGNKAYNPVPLCCFFNTLFFDNPVKPTP